MERRCEEDGIMEIGQFFTSVSADYDVVHCDMLDGNDSCYRIIADYLPEGIHSVLDLGIGTGLELEAIFQRFPNIKIDGVDLSEGMLGKLREKYADKGVVATQGSYFDFDFSPSRWDSIMSVMTLHHFNYPKKLSLYQRISGALKKGGVYLECDYMAASQEEEDRFFSEHDRIVAEHPEINGTIHYDTPITPENQIAILKCAGFSKVELLWSCGCSVILRATV